MELTKELGDYLTNQGWEVEEREFCGSVQVEDARASLLVDLSRSITDSFEWGDFDAVAVDDRHALGWYGVLQVNFDAETAWFFVYLDQSSGQEGDIEVDFEGALDCEVEDVGEPPVEALIEDYRGQPIDLCRVTQDWQCAVFGVDEGEYLIRTRGHEPAPYVTRFYPVDEEFAQTLLGMDHLYEALEAMEGEVQRQREEDYR